jgi:predicted porin
MKKTLVALAVLTAASSAQAFVVYDQDKITVDLKGDIEVQYQSTFDDSSVRQQIEDADFGFDVRYMVNDEVTVGGYWEFNGSTKSNATNAEAGDTYVAAYTKTYGSLKIGRLCTAIDDAGIGSDEVFGISSFFGNASACADEGIRYDFDNGSFYTTLGVIQDKDGNTALTDDSEYVDAKLGYRVADFDFTAFMSSGEVDMMKKDAQDQVTDAAVADDSLLGLEARYAGIENVSLELGYYASEAEVTSVSVGNEYSKGDKTESDTLGVAASYSMGLVGFAGGYSVTDTNSVDTSNWFLNTTYKVAPTAKLYVEVAGQDVDGGDNDTAFAIGAEASF